MGEMHFRPIPTPDYNNGKTLEEQDVWRLRLLWGQFIPRIAKRSGESEVDLWDAVMWGRVQVGLALDENGNAHALVGMVRRKAGNDLVGELHWATGWGVKNWQHLLAEAEQYLKQTGCTIVRAICRPGWKPLLKQHGYKQTHLMMERRL